LQLYQAAGADVLYAPGLTRKEDIATVLKSVDRPLNVLMALQGSELDLRTLSAMGVRRVSVGSALCRAALGAFLCAAREMRERGTFTFADDAVKFKEISELLQA
jgi:2-methylisocitrate lyase-like PEP mutase family enzyme